MVATSSRLPAGSAASIGPAEAAIWGTLETLLAGADEKGVLANKLGALAARSMRLQGRSVPSSFEKEARLARTAWMTAIPLLGRIRSLCEGPLLLIKGPEVSVLYPDRARGFVDVDLLCPDAEAVHAALRGEGFVEVDDPELFEDHHHLRPLQWPALWLKVEIHQRPMWPEGRRPPAMADIVGAAVPSLTGLRGLSAPHPAHHAVILASHAWVHEPLHTLRDLVDIAAVAARTDDETLAAVARAWGLERIWDTTYAAANALLTGRPRSLAVRVWGRHLPKVRERTVLGNQLQRWLHAFWELPVFPALRSIAAAFRQTALPYPGETWREKLIRTSHAIAHPRSPVSSHAEAWRDAAGASAAKDLSPHEAESRSSSRG